MYVQYLSADPTNVKNMRKECGEMDLSECPARGSWRGTNSGRCKSSPLLDFRVASSLLSLTCLRKTTEADCFIRHMDGWCVVLVDDFVLSFLFELLLDWRVHGGCINSIII